MKQKKLLVVQVLLCSVLIFVVFGMFSNNRAEAQGVGTIIESVRPITEHKEKVKKFTDLVDRMLIKFSEEKDNENISRIRIGDIINVWLTHNDQEWPVLFFYEEPFLLRIEMSSRLQYFLKLDRIGLSWPGKDNRYIPYILGEFSADHPAPIAEKCSKLFNRGLVIVEKLAKMNTAQESKIFNQYIDQAFLIDEK